MKQICVQSHIFVISIIMIIMLVAYNICGKKRTTKLRKSTDSKWHLKYEKDNGIDTLFDEWVKIIAMGLCSPTTQIRNRMQILTIKKSIKDLLE